MFKFIKDYIASFKKCEICGCHLETPYYVELCTESGIRYCKKCFTSYFFTKIRKENENEIRKIIKRDVEEFRSRWPNYFIDIRRNGNEWFISHNSWELFKTDEYVIWSKKIYDRYFDEGISSIIWGVSSSIIKDDLRDIEE